MKTLFRIVRWMTGIIAILYLGHVYYETPDYALLEDTTRIKQIAISDAREFLENKELFSEHEPCEPADDTLFKKNARSLKFYGKEGFTLYPETYLVKVASNTIPGRLIGKKDRYISSKARIFSKISRDKSMPGIVCTGLIFSESIDNNASRSGVMQKNYPYSDYRFIVVGLCVVLGLLWTLFFPPIDH